MPDDGIVMMEASLIKPQLLNDKFTELLERRGHLDPKQKLSIERTARELSITHFDATLKMGLIGEDTVYDALSELLNVPLINNVAKCPTAASVISTLSELGLRLDWAIYQSVFVYAINNEFHVATDNPTNSFALELLDSKLNHQPYQLHFLTPAMRASIEDELIREKAVSELFGQPQLDLASLADEAPVINLVNSILERAVHADASDIHVEAGSNSMFIRFRVDGKLIEYMQQPMARFSAIASRLKLLAELDIAERRLPQDGRFSFRAASREFDVRLSTAPEVNGESIVMRLLPKKRDELQLKSLGFESDHLALISKWGQLPNGIILVTGPTGSGKSTTLYGLLAEVKTGTEKIMTVEDPVEYQLPGITQVQANPEIGYTFARALRSFLRQDPDVIMIGEIRDHETAAIAVQASLTGHLVLSTLHTNDASSVFARLADIGIEPFMIAATIQGVQAQRLVRKLCSHCSESTAPPTFLSDIQPDDNWRKPVGCEKCQGRGYKGRIGIYELIEVTPGIRELVSQEASTTQLQKQARSEGFRTLFDDGLLKARRGLTSVEEVLRVCDAGQSSEV